MKTALADTGRAPLGFHMGHILLLIAERYPSLLRVLLEIVQNVLDGGAKKAELSVDLKKSRASCRDDGHGVTREEFLRALQEIGRTQKPSVDRRTGKRPLGEFGLGLLSPVGKFAGFSFISRPARRRDGFTEWIFDTEALSSATQTAAIPMNARPDLDALSWAQLPWNTITKMERLTVGKAATALTLEELITEIVDSFGTRIRENKLQLTIKFSNRDGMTETCLVSPPEFSGEELPEWNVTQSSCGNVRCRLFLRQNPERLSRLPLHIGILGSDFRVAWRHFSRRHGERISDEVTSAFDTGLFEGEILVEKCQLVAERTGFAENDALIVFLDVLKRWSETVGAKTLERHDQRRRSTHYQEIAEVTLRRLDQLVADTGHFRDILKAFRGSISDRHTEFPGKPLEGLYTTPRTVTLSAQPREEPRGRERPQRTKPSIIHLAVQGPKGHPRLSVRSESGLCISFEALPTSPRRWIFEEKSGTLRINVKHPDYSTCEQCGVRAEQAYQWLVLSWALSVHAQPPYVREQMIAGEKTFFPGQVWAFCHIESPKRAARR
ncbi:MAG: ATP-binding protein [bacterium]